MIPEDFQILHSFTSIKKRIRIKNASVNRCVYILIKIPRSTAKERKYFDLDATVCGVKTGSKRVEAKEQKQFIFIQTDKPIYKPGQKGTV